MSIRALLLILFLSIALIWVFVALFSGENLVHDGLLGTAIVLAVALAGVIIQQALAAWRKRHAQSASQPPRPVQKPSVLCEEAAALDVLRNEAMARLASSSEMAKTGGGTLSGRSLFLVLGPSGSGKTETLLNSGLDPQLLSGQVRGDSAVVPTRMANFWLAHESVFVELGGRLYESDQERWISLLRVLGGESNDPLWKRLWKEEHRPLLRGVLLFHDVRCALTKPDDAATGLQARIAQERLQAVADVFGATIPVYAIFTKADSVKFFGEFFGRTPESEASQAFGYTLAADHSPAPSRPMPWSERETRRLTRAFSTVYRHLAERRLPHLIRESDPSRKPDIYEFPREFRRIRGLLVQLLTDAFRPDPLKPGPVLRGFYFTGTRMVEADTSDRTRHGDLTAHGDPKIGRSVDYSEATSIFQPGAFKVSGSPASGPARRGPLQQRWMFTRQLFLETIPRDLPPVAMAAQPPAIEKYRVLVTASVAGLSLVMGLIWFSSWWRNWSLIQRAGRAIERVGSDTGMGPANVAELRALDGLRSQIQELSGSKRLGMRWMLYSGDDVRESVERLYFRRINALLVSQLNDRLADRLSGLPLTPPEQAEFGPVYDQLATHLALTSGGCKAPEARAISFVLKDEARNTQRADDGERSRLVEAQLDFYGQAVSRGYRPRFAENVMAQQRARGLLGNLKNTERIYQQIKALVSQKLPGDVPLSGFTADASKVLSGTANGVPAVFTPEGWRIFNHEAGNAHKLTPGDPCVLGTAAGQRADYGRSGELGAAVRILYTKEYTEQWRRFIAERRFEPYLGLDDAVKKLALLTGNRSPVLGLIAFVSKYTDFPHEQVQASAAEKGVDRVKAITGGRVTQLAEKLARPAGPEDPPSQITEVFQPVHSVVAPGEKNWTRDAKVAAYVTALADLGTGLSNIGAGSGSTPDLAVHQAARQAEQNALRAVGEIVTGFNSVGSEGVDAVVQRLLEAPIKEVRAHGFIKDNPEKAQADGLNGTLNKFCAIAIPILKKYPFTPSSSDDASPQEVSALLAPGHGALSELQRSSLAELVVLEGSGWASKAEGQKPRPSAELLPFLNRLQKLSNVFYPRGTAQPGMTYTLRPVGSLAGFSVTLEFDGKTVEFTEASRSQRTFSWPAPVGAVPGARGWISIGRAKQFFGSAGGLWGVFRVFGGADQRNAEPTRVQWSEYGPPGGRRERFDTPVVLEFVDSAGAAAVLNPAYFSGLTCPRRAVQ